MYLGNKTLCDICNSKSAKKRHKKVEKESAEQHQAYLESGSGDHNDTAHVEHAKEIPEGEFMCCLPRMHHPALNVLLDLEIDVEVAFVT